MRPLTLLVFSFALLVMPLETRADGMIHEMKIGALDHDTGGLWSGFSRESGVDTNVELIFNNDTVIWGGTVRPALGLSVNSVGDTSKVYGAARWEIDFDDRWLFALGVGAAAHNGETAYVNRNRKALGSSVLFYFPIEAGFRVNDQTTISVFFDHVSNAWLASPNEGMDTLGIRYGYRF